MVVSPKTDYLLLEGLYAKEKYVNAGYPANRIEVIGQPRYDNQRMPAEEPRPYPTHLESLCRTHPEKGFITMATDPGNTINTLSQKNLNPR